MRLSSRVYLVGSRIGLSDEFDCHVYLLDGGREKALIDAGMGRRPEAILDIVRSHDFPPSQISLILLTHSHADHAGGARALSEATGAVVAASHYEAQLVEGGSEEELGLLQAKRAGIFPEDYRFQHCKVGIRLDDGQEIEVGDLKVKALVTPGHTPGSTCYYVELPEGPAIFTGDTVFYEGVVGLLNLDQSNPREMRRSIRRLAELPVEGLYPGHGLFMVRWGRSHLQLAAKKMEGLFFPRLQGQWQ